MAKQLFLAICVQNNILRGENIPVNIQQMIQEDSCQEFLSFKTSLENFIAANTYFSKIMTCMCGMRKSRFFRKFIHNAMWARILKAYYLNCEKFNATNHNKCF